MKHSSRIIAATALWVLLAGGVSRASAGTKVVFTVDVESNELFPLPDQVDAVCAGGSQCGLMEIVRALNSRGWAGTFFLDVYEQKRWGEPMMRDLAARLQSGGQDVALHTHPQWAYDPARWAMHDYTLDEQTTIIRDGVRLLQSWTGRPVVAHRTGAYAADAHTFEALERNGILLDSSEFWQHANTRLDDLGLPRNFPSQRGRLTEIPVTAYVREDRPALFGAFFAPVEAVRKIDPNWIVNDDEMRSAVDAVVGSGSPVLVVMLHSFSFMASHAEEGGPRADGHALSEFRAIVDYVAEKHLPVVTMRQLAGEPLDTPIATHADVVPRVPVSVDVSRYLWHRAKGSARTLVPAAGGAIFFAAVLLVVVRHRRARRGRLGNGPSGRGLPAADGARR
jgi:hypothetical protein